MQGKSPGLRKNAFFSFSDRDQRDPVIRKGPASAELWPARPPKKYQGCHSQLANISRYAFLSILSFVHEESPGPGV